MEQARQVDTVPGDARGIVLLRGEDDLIRQRARAKCTPAWGKPSTLQDIEAGRPTEVEMFSGILCRLGRRLGVPTPVNDLFYHMIRVLEQKNAGAFGAVR